LVTSPALGELGPAALDAIARRARIIEFRKNERVAGLVNPPRRLIFLLAGLAKLSAATVDGRERIVYVFRPGDIIGSRVLMGRSLESDYEVVAMTRLSGVALELADFEDITGEHPEVLISVTQALTRRLARLTARLMGVMSEEVSMRLCRLLLDFADIGNEGSDRFVRLAHPLTHETMAHIVGASRPHTSTVLSELEQQGLVKRQRRDLLVNPQRLAEMVGDARWA
ncbi:MAG TPA: Crp/Fnr family transcriptional regulator, partial [Gemmatimonadota bacterium]|nr:Crp/Fnr family transcriptional regulator [Gemmatimonadota bacterium]